jgi:chromosome segregation ATPase
MEWSDLRADLERKLVDAQNLNESLQSELNRLRSDNANAERDLRDQLDRANAVGSSSSGEGGDWKRRFELLERDHDELKMELREQQQVIPQLLCIIPPHPSRSEGLYPKNQQTRIRCPTTHQASKKIIS